jgi:hypothetical protein
MNWFSNQLIILSVLAYASTYSSMSLYAKNDCSTECQPKSSYCLTNPSRQLACTNTEYRCSEHVYFGKTHYTPRPQGTHVERLMMGASGSNYAFERNGNYSALTVALAYSQTFHNNLLAQWFLPNGLTTINFGPTPLPNDPAITPPIQPLNNNSIGFCIASSRVDARSIDFGLSPTFKATACVKPIARTMVADIDCWMGLDACLCGLWSRINLPITYTSWEVTINEDIQNVGGIYYPENLVETLAVQTPNVANPLKQVEYHTITDAWCGNKPFGDAPTLQYGKVCCMKKSSFDAAGLRFDVGFDVVRSDCGYFGLGITNVASFGTTVKSLYLFEPIVGAQRSWQLGVTFSGARAINLRRASFDLHIDGTITHLFDSKQHRLFGLKNNGPWSQYLLLKKFRTASDGSIVYDQLERAANILSSDVKISCDAMVDIAGMVNYHNECGLSIKGGAGFWLRTREKINCYCPFTIPSNTYGIKGNTTLALTPNGTATRNQTASTSTIAYSIPDVDAQSNPLTIFLTNDDVDTCPALHPRSLSGTIFGSVEHHWYDREFTPFVLLGGEITFAQGNTTFNEWGAILKGGLEF